MLEENTLHSRLKKIRLSLKFSQKLMAAYLGCALSVWQRYENGKSIPGGHVITTLSDKGFDANWILNGKGNMEYSSAGLEEKSVSPFTKSEYNNTKPQNRENALTTEMQELTLHLTKNGSITSNPLFNKMFFEELLTYSTKHGYPNMEIVETLIKRIKALSKK